MSCGSHRASARRPIPYAILTAFLIVAGLLSRRYSDQLPPLLSTNIGDALWATVVLILIFLILPRIDRWKAAGAALAVSFLVEFSQLCHAPWLDALRATTAGGLMLGRGFVASDLFCYIIGMGFGTLLDYVITRTQPRAA